MSEISEIISKTETNGINLWTIDTTRSKLLMCKRNLKLEEQIDNREIHDSFAKKYGFLLTYFPDDFFSTFILSNLLKEFNLMCHPDVQDENSTLNKLNLEIEEINWILETCIYYDKEYNYTVDYEEFKESGFFPPIKLSEFEKTINGNPISRLLSKAKLIYKQSVNPKSSSKLYILKNPTHVHQAVICGGNSDVYKCPNYIGFKSENQRKRIINKLKSEDKPNLKNLVNEAEFYGLDFKGEDLGYARQLKIYSKNDISEYIEKIAESFNSYLEEYLKLNLEVETLYELEKGLNNLNKKYGC